ncbi:MAG: type II toxin-antitoxin system RelE/ParE family toxin [Pseudomonadales bacterium]
MQLKWTDLAEIDLDEIERHITQDNSPSVAIDVVINILDTTETVLSEYPNAGRMGRVKETRELVIDGIPFIVVYRVLERTEIQILRVLHDAQQWPATE